MPDWNELIRAVSVVIRKKPVEYWFYFLLLLLLFISYIAIGFFATRLFEDGDVVRAANFGFSQLKIWRFRHFVLFMVSVPLMWFFFRGLKQRLVLFFEWLELAPWRVELFIILFAFVMTVVFFTFSTNFLNYDGRELERKFVKDIPTLGFHATHDEMWELYLHSRFWFYTHQYFGWDVKFSYRVLSCLVGGIFMYALLKYAHQRFGRNWFVLTILICSGGYMQLFFGDVENYTMTIVLIFFFLWSADGYVQGKISLIVPATLLAIAMTFHLLSGFFLPALVYLYFLALQRQQYLHMLLGVVLMIGIVLLTLLFFDFHGLPLGNLWTNSHASGRGGDYSRYLVVPNLEYYFQIINLLFLLVPAVIFIIPLALFKRIKLTRTNVHLLIAAFGALIFTFVWKAQLGVYNDWNLYAITALPISLLIWTNFDNIPDADLKSEISSFAGFVFFLHSLSWISSNHWLIG